MPGDVTTIWTDQLFSVANVTPAPTPHVPFILGSSPPLDNGPTIRSSLAVIVKYLAITPDITDGSPPFTLGCVVETQVSDNPAQWVPIAYQFSPIRNTQDPTTRILRLQPDISDFNTGIDDSVYPINQEIARISRQQGRLPAAPFRICILAVDTDPGGDPAQHLVSARLSLTVERYDH